MVAQYTDLRIAVGKNKGYFFKGINALLPLAIAQYKLSVGAHTLYLSLETSVGIAIGIVACCPVQPFQISFFNLASLRVEQLPVVFRKQAEHVAQNGCSVYFLAQELVERYRVGGLTAELALVNVNAYSGERGGYVRTAEVVFEQHATNFTVAAINVIGPLDGD